MSPNWPSASAWPVCMISILHVTGSLSLSTFRADDGNGNQVILTFNLCEYCLNLCCGDVFQSVSVTFFPNNAARVTTEIKINFNKSALSLEKNC